METEVDLELIKLYQKLNKFIQELFPEIEQVDKYGGTLYNRKDCDSFCGVFQYTNHVTLEFTFGHLLNDSESILQEVGKYRRNLKPEEEIPYCYVKKLLKEAYKMSKE